MDPESSPSTVSPLDQAGIYHQKGQHLQAIRFYRIALQENPANAVALFFLGMAEWRMQGPEFGFECMERGLAVDPDVPDGRFNALNVVFETLTTAASRHQAGRLAEAAPLYRNVLRLDPEHAEALHLLGLVEWRTGDLGTGLALITKAMQRDSAIEGVQHNLGNAIRDAFALAVEHHKAGRLDEAGGLYAQILSARPDLATVRSNLQGIATRWLEEGIAHHQAGRLAEAAPFYRTVLRLDPDHPQALHLLGLVEWRAGDLGAGLALIAQAMQRDPTVEGLRHNLDNAVREAFALAVGHHKAGRLAEAGGLYAQILTAQPELAEVRNNLQIITAQRLEEGAAHHQAGRPAEAAAFYRSVLRLDPDHPQALHLLGLVEWRSGDLGAGLALIGQAMQRDPTIEGVGHNLDNAIRAASGMVRSLYEEERFEQAADLLECALRAGPERVLEPAEVATLVSQAQSMARRFFNAKRLTKAAEINDLILRLFPSADAFHLAGLIAGRRREHPVAVEHFRKAIEADPERSAYYTDLGNSLRSVGARAEAAEAFREGLEKDADFQEQARVITSKGHARRPVPTLLFCTSYIDSEASWKGRYGLWKAYYERPGVIDGRICMIDDGGRYDPPHRTVRFHRFAERLGRHSNADFPGWWRSFLFSVELARKEGFQKIVHIESDAFVFSERMRAYINGLDEGWTAFWCPLWQIPESAIQVIGRDQFEQVEKLARMDRDDPFFLGGAEYILPFTNVVKFFKGDRYGEYADTIPDDADYICQLDGAIKDRFVAEHTGRRILSPSG